MAKPPLLSRKRTKSGGPMDPDVRSHRHNRRPYRDPNAQPVKWMKLIQWWLVHRVPIDVMITSEIEAGACSRFKDPSGGMGGSEEAVPEPCSQRLTRNGFAGPSMSLPQVSFLQRAGHLLTPRIDPLETWRPTHDSGNTEQHLSGWTRTPYHQFGSASCIRYPFQRRSS
jgi:hypothetical protein